MKEKISYLLLFYISLGILAPSINLFFSNPFENNIVYISFEADGEADEKESEIEEKNPHECSAQIVCNAKVNPMLKVMIGKPLNELFNFMAKKIEEAI